MADLIAAFTIFLKYSEDAYPTSCEHDVMYVHVDPKRVDPEDLATLEELGFYPNYDVDGFESTIFGSS